MSHNQKRRRLITEPWVDLLAQVMRGMPRLPRAACVEAPELFVVDDNRRADDHVVVDQAVAMCRRCPELAACRRYVASLPMTHRPHGVVGGSWVKFARPLPKEWGMGR